MAVKFAKDPVRLQQFLRGPKCRIFPLAPVDLGMSRLFGVRGEYSQRGREDGHGLAHSDSEPP